MDTPDDSAVARPDRVSRDSAALVDASRNPHSEDYAGYEPTTPDRVGRIYHAARGGTTSFDTSGALRLEASGDDENVVARGDVQAPEREADPFLVVDKPTSSRALLAAVVLGMLGFVVVTVLAVLGSRCSLQMCTLLDRSSQRTRPYQFGTFEFTAPVPYALASLAGSLLGAAVLSWHAYGVLQLEVGSPWMGEVATYIRGGASRVLKVEGVAVVITSLAILGYAWVATNWRVALSYALGVVFSVFATCVSVFISTRGNLRTTEAARTSVASALKCGFRTASVVGLVLISSGLAGLSLCYIMFQDVRAMVGFSAGASTLALFTRVSGGVFTKGALLGSSLVRSVHPHIPPDDPRDSAAVAHRTGQTIGDVAGMGADLFESYVGSIVASAMLGSSLPYFFDNSYAMCIYNHLNIDQACELYAQPGQRLSSAAQLCRLVNLYVEYPELEFKQSNALFVAFPFLIALTGILVSMVCTFSIRTPTDNDSTTAEGRSDTVRSVLISFRLNAFIGALLVIACGAALSWGMFGPQSAFQRGLSGDDQQGYDRYEIASAGATDRCKITEISAADRLVGGSADEKIRVPQGTFTFGKYRPIDSFGKAVPVADAVPWRLFLCVVMGVLLGLLTAAITEYFTAPSYAPTRGVAQAGALGGDVVIMHGFGIGMIAMGILLVVSLGAIIVSHALFGAYGVGLAAVSMLSTLGITMTISTFGVIAGNAVGIAELADLPSVVASNVAALNAVGLSGQATAQAFSNGSALLTAFTLVAALIQEADLAPSPRDLVGDIARNISPARHILDIQPPRISDPTVVAGILCGAILPYLFAGLTLGATSRSAYSFAEHVHDQFRTISGLKDGNREARADHSGAIRAGGRNAVLEVLLLALIVIASPLVMGYALGQRSLVGLLFGALASGYTLSTVLCISGYVWASAREHIASGAEGERRLGKSAWADAQEHGSQIGAPLCGAAGPSLNILVKLLATLGTLAVGTLSRGPSSPRSWTGLGLLLVALVLFAVLSYRMRSTSRPARAACAVARTHGDTKGRRAAAPPLRGAPSPFYAPGPELPAGRVHPRSDIGEQLRARRVAVQPGQPRGAMGLPVLQEPRGGTQ